MNEKNLPVEIRITKAKEELYLFTKNLGEKYGLPMCIVSTAMEATMYRIAQNEYAILCDTITFQPNENEVIEDGDSE